jgi:hypothetical protein
VVIEGTTGLVSDIRKSKTMNWISSLEVFLYLTVDMPITTGGES